MVKENIGVLLIHGFAGSREEIRVLGEDLEDKGYPVSMPVLTGHEETREVLGKSTCAQWIDSADRAFREMQATCSQVVVVGFSMGGLIAANLYQRHRFAALVTINTPIYYWDIRQIIHNLSHDFKGYAKYYAQASIDKPLPALLEFQKLLSKTKPLFRAVECPALVIQTLDDDTVRHRSGEWINQAIPAKSKLVNPQVGGHVVLDSSHAQLVIEEISLFLSTITKLAR